MLEVEDLHKTYGEVVALDGVDLSVAAGDIVGLLGPNGAGKTTLVSIVAGLRRADRGVVRVDGRNVAVAPYETRRRIGLAPQDLGIYPVLSVRDNLLYFGELAELSGRELTGRIEEVADALELTHLLDRPARTLSGGEKRRLHTAMAMLHRPPLLLLDEPTTGVDVATRSRLLEVVRARAADGTAVCYSTHYLPEVESLGASVAILDQGRVAARGALHDLVHAHGQCYVELSFDGEAPDVPGLEGAERSGSGLRLPTADPAGETARVLSALGPVAPRLRTVEILRPSLESVFLAVTGRRYEEEVGTGVGAS